MSVRDQLTRLVELQAAEIDKRRVDAEIGALPGARAALQAQVEQARAMVSAAEEDREASLKRRRAFEGQLQEVEAKLDKYREQEMLVKTNEQLWAIQEEMKGAQSQISSIEEGILEEMERADGCVSTIQEAGEQLARVEAEVAETGRELDARQASLESESAEAATRIEAIRAEADQDLLAKYDRVASVRNGVAIAEAVGQNCSACNVQIRPQVSLEVHKMEETLQCDNCKRILFSREALQLPAELQVATE